MPTSNCFDHICVMAIAVSGATSLKRRVLQNSGPRTSERSVLLSANWSQFAQIHRSPTDLRFHPRTCWFLPIWAPPLWPRLQHGAKRCLVGPSAGVEERKQEPSSAPSLLEVRETPTCSDVCSVDAASASPLGDAARGELTCLRRGEDATLLRWPRSGSRRRHKPHHAA